MEEYGTGRYSRKHSTFYKVMMEELGLHTSKPGRQAASQPDRQAVRQAAHHLEPQCGCCSTCSMLVSSVVSHKGNGCLSCPHGNHADEGLDRHVQHGGGHDTQTLGLAAGLARPAGQRPLDQGVLAAHLPFHLLSACTSACTSAYLLLLMLCSCRGGVLPGPAALAVAGRQQPKLPHH